MNQFNIKQIGNITTLHKSQRFGQYIHEVQNKRCTNSTQNYYNLFSGSNTFCFLNVLFLIIWIAVAWKKSQSKWLNSPFW